MNFKIVSSVVSTLLLFICISNSRNLLSNAVADPLEIEQELRTYIKKLADEIGERNLYHPEKLNLAKSWIEQEFKRLGYVDVSLLPVPVEGSKYNLNTNVVAWNIEAVLLGSDSGSGTIVVGAHYDTKVAMPGWHDHWPPTPDHIGTPGANDNGSGVAALLYLAKKLRGTPHLQTVRFVAFVNEEPPFFQTEAMGSYVYARALKHQGLTQVRMISLETLGCFSEQKREKRSHFAWLVGLIDRPDYVAFLGNSSSRKWLKESARQFSQVSKIDIRTATLPAIIDAVAWSDDWSFWQFNYPAFSITDTAFLRSDFYHETGDTWDKIDYQSMAEVVKSTSAMIDNLADN